MMPDCYGFDHLGDTGKIRCIWCGWHAQAWRGPQELERHHRKHQRDRDLAAQASKHEQEVARSFGLFE